MLAGVSPMLVVVFWPLNLPFPRLLSWWQSELDGVADTKTFKPIEISPQLIWRLRDGVAGTKGCPKPIIDQALTTSREAFASEPLKRRRRNNAGNKATAGAARALLAQGWGFGAFQVGDSPAAVIQQSAEQQQEEAPQPLVGQHTHGEWVRWLGYQPMEFECPLFARRFEAGVSVSVREVGLSCEGLGLSAACMPSTHRKL